MLAIVFGFILAAMIDREKRGEGFFRTVFLHPLAVSLIVTGVAWRWMFNPTLGVQDFLHSVGLTGLDFNWLASSETAMHGIFLASIWQGPGFYMALMLSGLKSINTEIWSAARLSLGVVKAYDIVVAMTNGGPGQSTCEPAYFTINAHWAKSNAATPRPRQ